MVDRWFIRLVTKTDQVVAQRFDCGGCCTRLNILGMVGDEDGLGCLDNDHSLLALDNTCVSLGRMKSTWFERLGKQTGSCLYLHAI